LHQFDLSKRIEINQNYRVWFFITLSGNKKTAPKGTVRINKEDDIFDCQFAFGKLYSDGFAAELCRLKTVLCGAPASGRG